MFREQGGRQRGSGSGSMVPGYTKIKPVGEGGMSVAVNLVREERSGKMYVEKQVPIEGRHRRRTKAELSALKRVDRSDNFNQMREHLWDDRTGLCSIILEYCDCGSLDKNIEEMRSIGSVYADSFVWHVLVGISRALAFLHAGVRNVTRDRPVRDWDFICHLDLKPCELGWRPDSQCLY